MIKRISWVSVAVCVSTLFACGEGSVVDSSAVTIPPITELFTEAEFTSIESLGLQVNFGNSPPNIEGIFHGSCEFIE